MPFVIGTILSMGVAAFARRAGLDRDRAFYPTVLIVVASYYVLFATMGASAHTVMVESAVAAAFVIAAVVGFKSSAWIVVAALAGHGVLDAFHGHVVDNSGVPAWWPAFCGAYDLGAAGGLAWLVRRGLVANHARQMIRMTATRLLGPEASGNASRAPRPLDATLSNVTLPSAGAAAAALACRATVAAGSVILVETSLGHRKLSMIAAGSMSACTQITQRRPAHYSGGAPVYSRECPTRTCIPQSRPRRSRYCWRITAPSCAISNAASAIANWRKTFFRTPSSS